MMLLASVGQGFRQGIEWFGLLYCGEDSEVWKELT